MGKEKNRKKEKVEKIVQKILVDLAFFYKFITPNQEFPFSLFATSIFYKIVWNWSISVSLILIKYDEGLKITTKFQKVTNKYRQENN